ncbi:MAG TPA: YhdH/YhfP family quinone oxidoreductase [Desulfurivibrionaceae bacterium]|nr:YhdH/YhfP family quinone oxidoreductase [Desulfurivibrionaceae bacterium]
MSAVQNFRALVVREENGGYVRRLEERQISDLPAGEVLIRVSYSSLNYKDGLSAIGNRGVTRRDPHTPGVDAAGVVAESRDPRFRAGDQVLACCYDLGMNTPGGFGQYIRVPAAWVMPLPAGLSLRESMVYGTGGFTAANSVERLLAHGVRPDQGKVLVTGASGGVGCFSVAILAREGFKVTAVSGKESARELLTSLGASEIIGREQAVDNSGRMILKGKWAGVVDTVGGEILSTALKSTRYGGAVTCCGNVAGPEFSANVFPFILRGVALLGIDSAECAMAWRELLWGKLAREWRVEGLEAITTEIGLDELDGAIARILKGQVQGRVVVRLWDK